MTLKQRARAVCWPAIRRLPLPTVASLVVLLALLLPVTTYTLNGLLPGLIAINEESVGRRYFYSLRILYGDQERPWLPQGQLAGLTHQMIQLLLTVAGYPPSQLSPRIELWTLFAILIPNLALVIAFWWAVRVAPSALALVAFTATVVIFVYDRSSLDGFFVIMPDYYEWAFVLALVAAGWLIRRTQATGPPGLSSALLLGVFGGVCLIGKPSYAVYALAVGMYLVVQALGVFEASTTVRDGVAGSRWPRRIGRAVLIGVVGSLVALATWIGLTCLYYAGDVAATRTHFELTATFAGNAGSIESFSDWFWRALRAFPPDIALLSFVLPLILVASALTLPRPGLACALLPSSLISVLALVRRFYHPTMVETNAFVLLAGIVWTVSMFGPWLGARLAQLKRRQLGVVYACAVIGLAPLIALAGWRSVRFTTYMAWGIGTAATSSMQVSAFVDASPGVTLFAIPSNAHRPVTLDSAIRKGGTDPLRMVWADSPYVQQLAPKRWYVDGLAPPDVRDRLRIPAFEQFVYVVDRDATNDPRFSAAGPPGPVGVAAGKRRLMESFGLSTVGYDCSFFTLLVNWNYAIGCRRQQAALAPAAGGPLPEAQLVTTIASLDGDTLTATNGAARPIQAGDLFLVTDERHQLLRREADGSYTDLTGAPGQRITVRASEATTGIGKSSRTLAATFSSGRWQLDPDSFAEPVLRDEAVATGQSGASARRWGIAAPGEAYRIEELTDADGPFVRITATAPASSLLLTARESLPLMAGGPALISAQVRGRTQTIPSLTLHDARCAQPAVVTGDRLVLDERQWRTATVWTDTLLAADPADHVTFGIRPAAAGDWFDIRQLAVRIDPEYRRPEPRC